MLRKIFIIAVLFSLTVTVANAQENDKEFKQLIIARDSAFWNTFNTCDTNSMSHYIANEVEFYHDKGGPQKGLATFLQTTKKNLCGELPYRLRREVVAGTAEVFVLKNNNEIYGSILSGQHVFYVLETGKKERLDGLAKFTHLWLMENGEWKMSRILSYDHGSALKN